MSDLSLIKIQKTSQIYELTFFHNKRDILSLSLSRCSNVSPPLYQSTGTALFIPTGDFIEATSKISQFILSSLIQ